MSAATPDQRIGDYKRLPYTRGLDLREEEDGETYFLARIEELDGVEASGETPHEALYNLQDAFDSYLRAMTELGREIPTPETWPDRYPGEWPSSDAGAASGADPAGTGEENNWAEEEEGDFDPQFPNPADEEELKVTP